MLDYSRRVQMAEEMLRRFASAVRGAQLYAPSHPLVSRNIGAYAEALNVLHGSLPVVTVGFVQDEIVVGDVPVPRVAASMVDLATRLRENGIERVTIERGVGLDELMALVHELAHPEAYGQAEDAGTGDSPLSKLPHVNVGRIRIEERVEAGVADMAAVRRTYAEAVTAAESIWETLKADGTPDPNHARLLVQGLAQAVSQNRTALLALTALRSYDNYTFTHMVNVAILVMAQARSLGIEGPLLREFGIAGLMHDIGKVRTPVEILNKPDRLTDAEMTVMRRHPIDGAAILRRTPELPPLASMVAFEHHLRLDGTGYPAGVTRSTLNLATMLCSISDVYDAMRSQRKYQEAFPTERILTVLKRNEGREFDQHLVRRFVQILGVYPPGTLVRLERGDVAVVVRVHSADPYRPRVRLLFDQDRRRLEVPVDLDLRGVGDDLLIAGPVAAEDYQIDPLACL